MEEEIKAEFKKSGFALDDEEEILKKCLTFCINYNLKSSDLVSSWEVYYLNRQLDESTVRNAEMDGFLLHLQNEQKEAVVKEEPNLYIYSSKDVDMILNYDEEDMKEEIPGTPTDKSLRLNSEPFDSTPKSYGNGYSSGKPSKHVTPFGRRTDKFVVKFNINSLPVVENNDGEHDHGNLEDEIIKRAPPCKKCSLMVHRLGPEPGCRFMYDRIEDRFNALENRIRKHATALCASGLCEEPMDPTIASQRNIFAIGMICCDGEGRLNEKSIMLQSSVEHSGGRNVRLELHNLSQFSIFPGQIVGVEGQNPSGHCLIASKMVDSVPLSATAAVNQHPTKKQVLDLVVESTDSSYVQKEISALIASGPFTTTDNLYFEPLTELLAYASRKLPQLLVLMGPFVDSEHPEVKKGAVDRSFDELFSQEILRRLQEHVEYAGSDVRVILVPSIRDAQHDFVFPQPAFDIHLPNLKHQITGLTNPGNFEANQINYSSHLYVLQAPVGQSTLNCLVFNISYITLLIQMCEVRVGCCTVDILKQMSGEEMSRNPTDGTTSDRMSRLANHIISQRSFYPLYPPAEDIPLDSSLAPEALDITSIPDILILPSDVKYFIKVLTLGEGEEQRKCICINPGRLAKGEGGGTFAELNYQGSPDKMKASIIGI